MAASIAADPKTTVLVLEAGGTDHESQTKCGTAKMGRDDMSVVDGQLRVYGLDNLRIADGSNLPRVTSGNTMAPCVVIGEQAAAFLQKPARGAEMARFPNGSLASGR